MADPCDPDLVERLPGPIARPLGRLWTEECCEPGASRLTYLLNAGEALACFLGVVTLGECREVLEAKTPTVPLPEGLSSLFPVEFKKPSWGKWTQALREGQRFLRDASVERVVMPELGPAVLTRQGRPTAALDALERLCGLRNDIQHHRIEPRQPREYKDLCAASEEGLRAAIEGLSFIQNYDLFLLNRVEVRKSRLRDPAFEHRFSRIAGTTDLPRVLSEVRSSTLEPEAVLLCPRDRHRALNLDPFLIYDGDAGIAPDIFFYNGMRSPEQAYFTGFHRGGTIESPKCRRYREITEELDHLLVLFSRPGALQEADGEA